MKTLYFDFSGVRFSTCESAHLDTGLSLVAFDRACLTAADIRGGAVASREISSIDELNSDGAADAIVLAGGSTYGLEATSGVMKKLFEHRNYSSDFQDIPCIPSAIVYDFRDRKDKKTYPNREMGESAFDQLKRNQLNYGRAGAGANVHVGKCLPHLQYEKAGQGAHFFEHQGIKILALTVVNAMGNILDESGRVVRGSLDSNTGQRKHISPEWLLKNTTNQNQGNTTISLLITNAKLDRLQLKRLAVMTHSGMARMIEPFHTPWDGDCLFAVSTAEKDLHEKMNLMDLSVQSIRCMQTAILKSWED
jgi:L-aminopeptidase/D-esterase-like protein